MDLITKDSNITQVLFSSLDRMLENVEYMVTNYHPVLGGEHYLTGEEVCQKLCISKRTLQDYTTSVIQVPRISSQDASSDSFHPYLVHGYRVAINGQKIKCHG